MISIKNESYENNVCTEPFQMSVCSATHNFRKGSYIELSTGVLRKVEDMRTEDFIQSAENSPHQLAESTVVKINTMSPSAVLITFNYDKNNTKIDLKVSTQHPFFVYGQGWASCDPEMTIKSYGIKCEQQLQVGDICLSLITREMNISMLKHQLDVSIDPATKYAALLNFTWNWFPSHLS